MGENIFFWTAQAEDFKVKLYTKRDVIRERRIGGSGQEGCCVGGSGIIYEIMIVSSAPAFSAAFFAASVFARISANRAFRSASRFFWASDGADLKIT